MIRMEHHSNTDECNKGVRSDQDGGTKPAEAAFPASGRDECIESVCISFEQGAGVNQAQVKSSDFTTEEGSNIELGELWLQVRTANQARTSQ